MLDAELKEQLKAHLSGLGHTVELVVSASAHEQQAELVEMLNDVAECSDELHVRVTDVSADLPQFAVHADGRPTGMRFVGIPGGHEFTSLVVAILNAGGKGKLPDAALVGRIRRIGAGKVRTYISQSCENCPDVVQALHQIALTHGKLEHTMIDGALVQGELERLKVQGVPSVFVGDELVHSGRATLPELIAILERALGREQGAGAVETDLGRFDVAVLGGGPAGVSAAVYSARKGLKTVLIAEQLGGQLQQTKGIENMISVVYTEGPELAAKLNEHLRAYPVQVLEHRRVKQIVRAADGGVSELHLDSGERLTADSTIVATGAKWRELGVPGEKQYIGRGVAFCAHCDGPYYAGKKVAVVGGGNSGVEAAIDLAGITSEVVLLEFMPELKADDVLVNKLKTLPNVRVVTNAKTQEVVGDGEKVVALRYEERQGNAQRELPLDGVFVQIGLSPNSALVKDLVETNRYGEIVVDGKGRTSAEGIYAAGDVTTVAWKQIVTAMGDGAKAALTAFEDRMRAPAAAVREAPARSAASAAPQVSA
jgi:alkyl hydroperoxide reductase subunit F